jgi:hypothetical protein
MIVRYRKDDLELYDSEHWSKLIVTLKGFVIDESFGEFANEASIEKEKSLEYIEAKYTSTKKAEEDAAELKRLQKAEEDRLAKEEADRLKKEQAERDEKIRKEAAAKAAKEAEEREANLKREKEEAEQRQKDAEERAAREKKEAEERLEREKEAAAQAERDRIAAEKKAEKDAAAKREANKKHQTKINNAVVSGLVQVAGIKESEAKEIVTAIAKGEVPHVSIKY